MMMRPTGGWGQPPLQGGVATRRYRGTNTRHAKNGRATLFQKRARLRAQDYRRKDD